MISAYLLDIIILLLAAVIVVPLSQSLKLGAVPGFLIAGVIVGPFGFGLINNITEIANFAEIGIVLLLFVIGIQLKPARLWQMRRLVFGLGALQLLFTGLLLGCISHFIFNIPLPVSILIGPTLALSSTAFVLQLLTEHKLLGSTYGRTSFAILLLQDLAVVPLLALLPLLATPEINIGKDIGVALAESLFILSVVILVGRYFLHPILHRVALSGNPEVFTASAVLIVLGTALITEHIGLSMAMGAFLAGLMISDSSYRHQIIAEILPFRGLLIGLFFMSMGMALNTHLLFDNPTLCFALVGLLISTKAVILMPLVYFFGVNTKNSIAVSLILAQSGEFALVLFSLAFQASILSASLFQQLLLIVLLSMLVTPILAYIAHQLIKRSSKTQEHIPANTPIRAPIVLAGFGRVGRRIGEILTLIDKPFVALDSDAQLVEREHAKGYPVYYGDVCKLELLKSAGINHAKIIIVTLDDPTATEEVVSSLRKTYPKISIYARGHSLNKCSELRRRGATGVVSENIEASLELTRMVLTNIGFNHTKRETLLDEFRRKYHAQIDATINEKKE
ncbi:MAG: cation:proton antiporter [Methylococcales bacterium]|nr:cation:proton antiporter [Methylococcales bacterium]